jgi:hypothetical protein
MLSLVENLVESTRTVSSVGIQKLELADSVFNVMLSVLCMCFRAPGNRLSWRR